MTDRDIFTVTPRAPVATDVLIHAAWTLEAIITNTAYVSYYDEALQCCHFKTIDVTEHPHVARVHPLLHTILFKNVDETDIVIRNRFTDVPIHSDKKAFVAFWFSKLMSCYCTLTDFRARLLSETPTPTILQRILNARRTATSSSESNPNHRRKRTRDGTTKDHNSTNTASVANTNDGMDVETEQLDPNSPDVVATLSAAQILARANWPEKALHKALGTLFKSLQNSPILPHNIPSRVCKCIEEVIMTHQRERDQQADLRHRVVSATNLNQCDGWDLVLLCDALNLVPNWIPNLPMASVPTDWYALLAYVDLPWLSEAGLVLQWVLSTPVENISHIKGTALISLVPQDDMRYPAADESKREIAIQLAKRICAVAPSHRWTFAKEWQHLTQVLHAIANHHVINTRAAQFRREARDKSEHMARPSVSMCNTNSIIYFGKTKQAVVPTRPSDHYCCVVATNTNTLTLCECVEDTEQCDVPETVRQVWYVDRQHLADWSKVARWVSKRSQLYLLRSWQSIASAGDVVQQSAYMAEQIIHNWKHIVPIESNRAGIVCLPRVIMAQGLGCAVSTAAPQMSSLWTTAWTSLSSQGLCSGLFVTIPDSLQVMPTDELYVIMQDNAPIIIPHAESLMLSEWENIINNVPETTSIYLMFSPLCGGNRFISNSFVGAGEGSSLSVLLAANLPLYPGVAASGLQTRNQIDRDSMLLAQLQALVSIPNESTGAQDDREANAANESLIDTHTASMLDAGQITARDTMRQILTICEQRLATAANRQIVPVQPMDIDAFLLRSTPSAFCAHLANLYNAQPFAMTFMDAHVLPLFLALELQLLHRPAATPKYTISLSPQLHPLHLATLLCNFDAHIFVPVGQSWREYANHWQQQFYRYAGFVPCLPYLFAQNAHNVL